MATPHDLHPPARHEKTGSALGRRAPALVCLVLLVGALPSCARCQETAGRDRAEAPPIEQAPGDAPDAAEEPLPEGVRARVEGKQGTIEVVERDGLRQLVIGGTVHAAVPLDGAPLPEDPLVALLRAVRPGAPSALVIGLGSGRTAGELAASGAEVLAVELEPAVVDLARRFFDYRGECVVADGLAHLASEPRRWDVIVVDALQGRSLPAPFLTDEAVELMRSRLNPGGVLAVRMVDRPDAPSLSAFSKARDRRHRLWFGSGVGDEEQNLYLLDSSAPLSYEPPDGLALWPLLVPGSEGQRLSPSRHITLLGYLVRVGPEETLCLDLLHWEMGAVRYVLRGDTAVLAKRAPKGQSPSLGDLSTDGDVSNTLHDALGSAGFKRSDVRYSPTVVALRGTATLQTAINPDDLRKLRARGRTGDSALLPWGGVLYELEVEEVLTTFELADWRRLRKRALAPVVRRLHRAASKGELQAASEAAREYTEALERALGEWAPRFEVHRRMKEVEKTLREQAVATKRPVADACEATATALYELPSRGYMDNPDTDAVAEALTSCAERERAKR